MKYKKKIEYCCESVQSIYKRKREKNYDISGFSVFSIITIMDRFDLIHNIDNKVDNRCMVVARVANIEFRSSLNRFLLPIPRAGNLLIRSSLNCSFAH